MSPPLDSARDGPRNHRRGDPDPVEGPRERLLRALRGERFDRPAVICPGGMMTMATVSAMRGSGCRWPAAHSDARAMAELVLAAQRETGLECLSVPFCMTVEAEALGCQVDLGTRTVIPHVAVEALADADGLAALARFDPERRGRAPVVLEAIRILRRADTPYPVMGAVVGPVSLAAMVMEASKFLRLARRAPDAAETMIRAMAGVTLDFALAERAAGADCVMIAEPSATGEVLGGAHFARLALPALSGILGRLHEAGVPVILHICGDLRRIVGELQQLASNVRAPLALSVDALVSGEILRRSIVPCVRVGNVDALLLQRGPLAAIESAARRAARDFDIVSPACGLVPMTPARNLAALVKVVRHGEASHEG